MPLGEVTGGNVPELFLTREGNVKSRSSTWFKEGILRKVSDWLTGRQEITAHHLANLSEKQLEKLESSLLVPKDMSLVESFKNQLLTLNVKTLSKEAIDSLFHVILLPPEKTNISSGTMLSSVVPSKMSAIKDLQGKLRAELKFRDARILLESEDPKQVEKGKAFVRKAFPEYFDSLGPKTLSNVFFNEASALVDTYEKKNKELTIKADDIRKKPRAEWTLEEQSFIKWRPSLFTSVEKEKVLLFEAMTKTMLSDTTWTGSLEKSWHQRGVDEAPPQALAEALKKRDDGIENTFDRMTKTIGGRVFKGDSAPKFENGKKVNSKKRYRTALRGLVRKIFFHSMKEVDRSKEVDELSRKLLSGAVIETVQEMPGPAKFMYSMSALIGEARRPETYMDPMEMASKKIEVEEDLTRVVEKGGMAPAASGFAIQEKSGEIIATHVRCYQISEKDGIPKKDAPIYQVCLEVRLKRDPKDGNKVKCTPINATFAQYVEPSK